MSNGGLLDLKSTLKDSIWTDFLSKVRGGLEHYPQLAAIMTELEKRQVVGEDWKTEGLVDVDRGYRRVDR